MGAGATSMSWAQRLQASVAARAPPAVGGGARNARTADAQPGEAGAASGTRPRSIVDDEGFILCQRRRREGASASGSGEAGDMQPAAATGDSSTPPRGARGGGEEEDVGGRHAADGTLPEDGMEVDGLAHDDGGDEHAEGGEQAEPSHRVLWRELQEEKEELRTLRKKWSEDHWTVRTAVERVEAIEAAWRREKPATTSTRRLQRAEQAAKRAEGRVSQLAGKLKEVEDEYWRRRGDLEHQLQEAQDKLRAAEDSLRDARMEVGAEAKGHAAAEGRSEDSALLRETVEVLKADIGPQLLVVAEMVDTGEADEHLKAEVQSVVSKIHNMFGVLRDRTEQAEVDKQRHYDLTGEDSEELPELTEADYMQYGYPSGGNGHGWGAWDGWGGHSYHQYQYGGGWGGWANAHQHQHGCDWHYGHDRAIHGDEHPQDGHDARPPKKGRTETSAMEVQTCNDMHAPEHIEALNTATEAAAKWEAQGVPAPQTPRRADGGERSSGEDAALTAHQKNVADFVACAKAKGIDISDIDVGNIDAAELQREAQRRLA